MAIIVVLLVLLVPAMDDGSVLTFRDVQWFDDRLLKVGTWHNGNEFESVAAGNSLAPAAYSQMPRN